MKNKILVRAGRYAVIKRENDTTPFVVCCSYCDRTGTWGNGFYFKKLGEALADVMERLNYACLECENCDVENHPPHCMR